MTKGACVAVTSRVQLAPGGKGDVGSGVRMFVSQRAWWQRPFKTVSLCLADGYQRHSSCVGNRKDAQELGEALLPSSSMPGKS